MEPALASCFPSAVGHFVDGHPVQQCSVSADASQLLYDVRLICVGDVACSGERVASHFGTELFVGLFGLLSRVFNAPRLAVTEEVPKDKLYEL